MEAVEIALTEEAEAREWGDSAAPSPEDEELVMLAYELWKRASRSETEAEQNWLGAEEELLCHASSL